MKKIIGVFICVLIVSGTLNIIVCDTASADAGDILFSFNVPEGFLARGLTYYGSYIVAGGPTEDSEDYQQIIFFNQSGNVSYSFNFNHPGDIRGLASAPPYIYILNYETEQTKIYKYFFWGSQVNYFSLDPNKVNYTGGLTYGDGHLWYSERINLGNYQYRYRIHKITTTGSYISSFIASNILAFPTTSYQGLAYAGSHLWFTSQYSAVQKIWKLNLDGSEVFSFAKPDGADASTDLAWDGEYLWVGSFFGFKINKMDVTDNNPPNQPSKPQGPAELVIGASGTYTTSATDPDGDQVKYRFDWDDGEISDWTSFVNSGMPSSLSHSWANAGSYEIRSQAMDSYGEKSVWSEPKTVKVIGVSAGGPYYGFKDYYVQFFGYSSQGTPISWHWNFGDGASSNEQNPKHTYSPTGSLPHIYTATLTVTFSNGTTASDTASVEIKDVPALAKFLISVYGTYSHWDGSCLSATVPLSNIQHIINLDGSVPGNISIGDFSGTYNFGINWNDTKIDIELYPANPENDKMILFSGVELNIEAYNVLGAGGSFSCGAQGDFDVNSLDWNLMLYLNGHLQFPILRLQSFAGPIPISAAADLHLDGDLKFYLNSPDEFDDHVFDQMTGSLSAGGNARGGIGFTGIINAGLYGGIDGTWSFITPEDESGSVYNSFIITISFGAYAEIIYLGYWDWEWYSYSWPSTRGASTSGGYQFMPRNYGTPTWINNDEGVLIDDAFPASNPSISTNSNGDRIMVWTQDDLSIGGSGGAKGDGLEIWYSTWDKTNEKWNQRLQVTDDNYAQSNPSVTLLDNGDAICVFNCLTESAAGKTLNQIFSESEIGYCYFHDGTWTTPQLIGATTNRFMDSFPVIKSNGNKAVVVWVCDNDANIFTATTNDKAIYTSFWAGNGWSVPRILTNKNVISAPVSLAFKNGEAACAYTVDEDGDLNTANDQNIYVTTFTDNTRNDNTIKITSTERNGHPSVSYIGESGPSVSWVTEVDSSENLNATIYYMDNINARSEIEEVESGIGTVSSAPLFSGTSGVRDEIFPLVGWSDGNNICFKRRFGPNDWEARQVLHISDKKIGQIGWDYNGSGEEVYAVFIEKEDLNSQNDCQLRIAGKGQLLTPDVPEPSGPKEGVIYEEYCFQTKTFDPTDGKIYFKWSWGDGTYSEWLGPYYSGDVCNVCHYWNNVKEYNVRVKARNNYRESEWSEPLKINIKSAPPSKPLIKGPKNGKPGEILEYSFYSSDPDKQDIEYFIDWGDGDTTGWIGPYKNEETIKLKHVYSKKKVYTIRAKARDSVYGGESDWSTFSVSLPRTRSSFRSLLLERLMNLAERFPLLQKLFYFFILRIFRARNL
ncbi:MAG: PKD domain-containing protein [Candidatus Thermoplasmatota archaeon]|jgi:PKD repeat protein|nr:PKD domain-containing protein [Candidatus Thermoplasmatota archaeon]